MVDEKDIPAREEITNLLHLAAKGDKSAADELMRTIGKELRKIASIHLRRERPNHTLQTTDVVNEAFIRLFGKEGREWNNRQHFLSAASQVMRHLLVDYARRRFFEVTTADEVVWEYVNPYFVPASRPPQTQTNSVFRVYRYTEEEVARRRRAIEARNGADGLASFGEN